ncbi:MAG: NCS2 family permease [Desulfovibrio sp.]|nr:NCS2 family permease [Desulfovibrio sp.]
MNFLNDYFQIEANNSSVRTELIAGLTSFMAMCYLIFVVPSMLADAGMPREAATSATIWITILATLLMGLWAKFPVAVAPGLGITAFFAYYICGPAGYSWETGLGAVFISGVVFLLLTVTKIRRMIIDAIPMDLKYSIVVGIGAFIAFIGMKNCGMIVANPSTFVALGDLTAPNTLMAICGLFLTASLMCLRIRGAMIIGIAVISLAGLLTGMTPWPSGSPFSFDIAPPRALFMKMDLPGALAHGLFSIIFTLTMVDLFDNMGVLIGLAQKAGFMKPDGQIKNLDKALMTDSLATMGSAVVGATTATSYLECAAGVAAGGRTGLTALTIAGLFFLSLFFTPIIALVPSFATSPILILVGALMMQEVINIKFSEFSVAAPAFLTIISMPLTFNIATGFGFGFISFVALKLFTGRFREVNPFMFVIAVCFVINFTMRL